MTGHYRSGTTHARTQAGQMSSETLHRVLREKLISTVKPGGGTLLRTYHNLHRSGNVGEWFIRQQQ